MCKKIRIHVCKYSLDMVYVLRTLKLISQYQLSKRLARMRENIRINVQYSWSMVYVPKNDEKLVIPNIELYTLLRGLLDRCS